MENKDQKTPKSLDYDENTSAFQPFVTSGKIHPEISDTETEHYESQLSSPNQYPDPKL